MSELHECDWQLADGCSRCGDDNCLVLCEGCGEKDRACED